HAYDPRSGELLASSRTAGLFPHAMLLADGRLYLADEGASAARRNRVEVFDAATLGLVATYPVGKNPGALALSPDRATLYIAASDDDWIDRIDLAGGRPLQPFMLEAPAESGARRVPSDVQPSALAPSPDAAT